MSLEANFCLHSDRRKSVLYCVLTVCIVNLYCAVLYQKEKKYLRQANLFVLNTISAISVCMNTDGKKKRKKERKKERKKNHP